MAIYKVDDGYCISSGGTWLPGVYNNTRTARWAFKFPVEALSQLQEEANLRTGGTGGTIVYDDLVKLSQDIKAGLQ
jgi:hypothetical protein